jgi:hypothetical protein
MTLAVLPVSRVKSAALESLSLTSQCLPHQRGAGAARHGAMPAMELLAQLDTRQLACCSDCHASTAPAGHVRAATTRVAQSCQACHPY